MLTVHDQVFADYGRVVAGYDTRALCSDLERLIPLSQSTDYCPRAAILNGLPQRHFFQNNLFGGLPVQFGYCCGFNTRLDCLEYHKSNEFFLGTVDYIWLLAKRSDMKDWQVNTRCIVPFVVPAGVVVELYSTTLHYMPCTADARTGFRVMAVSLEGTGGAKPSIDMDSDEDRLLWGCNKWLLSHAETAEAALGTWQGLVGGNIDVRRLAGEDEVLI